MQLLSFQAFAFPLLFFCMAPSSASSRPSPGAGVISRLGLASGFLEKNEERDLAVACEALKEVLSRRVRCIVRDNLGLPMLSSKSCDGTPLSVACSFRTSLPSGKTITTKGRKGCEFLVCNQFVRCKLPTGEWSTSVLLAEPIPLSSKGVQSLLAAARQNWVTLRSIGHRGFAIEHYVWDRAGLSALERQTRLWHEMQPVPEPPKGVKKSVMALSELVVVTPCALHDAQNGFRWGLLSSCKDTQLMRDLYISVESLRNSMDLLSSRLAGWLTSVLCLVEPRDVQWQDDRRALLEALAVDPEIAELLLELQLDWDGRRLNYSREAEAAQCTAVRAIVLWGRGLTMQMREGLLWERGKWYRFAHAFLQVGDGDPVQVVMGCLLGSWRFRKFTESRWLTIGTSCRTLIMGVLYGLDGLVQCIQQERWCGDLFSFVAGQWVRELVLEKMWMGWHVCSESRPSPTQ